MLQTQILRSTAMSLWLRKFRISICSYTGQDGQTITPFGCTEFGWSGVIRLSLSPAKRLGSQAQHCLQPRYPAQTMRKSASQRGFPASQHFSVHPNVALIEGTRQSSLRRYMHKPLGWLRSYILHIVISAYAQVMSSTSYMRCQHVLFSLCFAFYINNMVW